MPPVSSSRTAELFVEHGAQVVIAGRSVEKGEVLAEKLGDNAVFARTDVTREGDIEAMIDAAVVQFGHLDCLFNNAASSVAGGSVDGISLEEFEAGISLLLTSAFLGMKYAVPLMKRQRSGSIINNASVAGTRVGFGSTLYSTAKAAMIHMGKCSAMELAQFGVRVNSISPGGIATPIFGRSQGFGPDQDDSTVEKMTAYFTERLPLRRAGLAEDIAYGALYLASDESALVTGHDLVIDSGITLGKTFDEWTASGQRVSKLLRGDSEGLGDN